MFVHKGGIAEYVGHSVDCLSWCCGSSCAEVARLAKFEVPFGCCWHFHEVCMDELRSEEGNVGQEIEICCMEEGLHGWAEEGLVHVLDMVA